MRYDHLLFDLDGTLSDPKEGITRSVQYALKHFGIEVEDLDTLEPFIGPPLQDSFRDFYNFSPEKADEACDQYHDYFIREGWYQNELYPDIIPLLDDLRSAGATLYVATSKPEPLAKRILKHFGIDNRFKYIAGDTMERTRSAKSDVLRHLLQFAHITDKNSCAMIGDRRFDIEGASSVGISSIGILYGYGDAPELIHAGATHIVSSIEALRNFLLAEGATLDLFKPEH